LFNHAFLTHIDTIKELSDTNDQPWNWKTEGEGGAVLFVSDVADLLNVGGRLRNVVKGFAFENQFILDVCGDGDLDAGV